MSNSIHHMEFS